MLFRRKNISLLVTAFTILFLFTLFNLLFPQSWLIETLSPYICPNAVYFKTTDKPIITLTIDDSPDPQTTKEILAVLNKYKVKATFFTISNRVLKNPEVTQAIVKAGHEIGNHLTKDEPSIRLGENFEPELAKAHKILSNYSTNINWFRPGSGFCDRSMIDIAKQYNYQTALGSVWSYDTNIPSSKFATWFILANTKPGSIIVLHDIGDRGERTVKTLENIIPKLQKKGYQFVTLSNLEPLM